MLERGKIVKVTDHSIDTFAHGLILVRFLLFVIRVRIGNLASIFVFEFQLIRWCRLRTRFSDDGLLIPTLQSANILPCRLLLDLRWSLVKGTLLPGLLAAVAPLRGDLAARFGQPWRVVEAFHIIQVVTAEGIWLNRVIQLVERGVH
jgi:hypothetical protein